METYLFLAIFFFFGAALGSFLNVVAWRIVRGETFTRGRSYCPHCRRKLSWVDLIPVLSFIVLCGRCRTCRAPISYRYFLVECLMGFYIALLIYFAINGGLLSPFPFLTAVWGSVFESAILAGMYLLVAAIVLVISLIDYETKLILVTPLRFLGVLGLAAVLAGLIIAPDVSARDFVVRHLLLAVATGGFFVLVWVLTRGRGMGLGDAELGSVLALFLPWPLAIPMLLFAFWSGALVGVTLIVLYKYRPRAEIPFGPFLALGFALALFGGRMLLSNFMIMI